MDLYDRIKMEVRTSANVLGGQEFVPFDKIKSFLTRETVKSALSQPGLESNEDLARFILQKAGKVFLTLAFGGHLELIKEFYKEDFDDSKLPVDPYWEGIGLLNEMTEEPHPRYWPLFNNLGRLQRDSFFTNQWLFLATEFKKEEFGSVLHKRRPLPFFDPDESKGGTLRRGNFSRVYRVKVHSAYAQGDVFRQVRY